MDSGALIEAEALDFARLSSFAYQRAVTWYRTECGMSSVEADVLARTPLRSAAEAPSHEVSWMALNTLLDNDPALAATIWERVKRDAAGYVAQGSMTAEALAYDTPWQRAQFFAVLQGFCDEWQPRGGVERSLLETMAHAFCAYLWWAGAVQQRATTEPSQRRETWELPLQSAADALDEASRMMQRFNLILIRTLRALRDLPRNTVVINNPGQVNMGDKQVNIQGGHDV